MFPADIEQVIDTLEHVYVPHQSIDQVIKRSLYLIKKSGMTREPVNILLTGNGGTGKTTVCKGILKEHPRSIVQQEGLEINAVPVLNTSIPSGATIKNLVSQILDSFGADYPTKGSRMELTLRLKTLLKNCKTRAIILDEFQHLKRTENTNHQPIIDWIKDLINQMGIPIIVVGIPQCKDLILEDSQLARRFTHQFQLANLDREIHHGFFNTFIKLLTSQFEFKCSENFLKLENTLPIYAATGGNPSDTTTLINEVIDELYLSDSNTISKQQFSNAITHLNLPNAIKIRKSSNPYDVPLEQLQRRIGNHAYQG